MPERQRAALVLRDVLGFGTEEVAAMLDVTEQSVKGALQRARATLEQRLPVRERAPLSDQARLTMPPLPLEYIGQAAIAEFLDDRAEFRGAPLELRPTRANGQPAFGCYLNSHAWGLLVLTLSAEQIAEITWFSDPALLLRFGLPRRI